MAPATEFRPAREADIPAALALIEGAYRGESAKRGWTHEADLLGGQRTDAAALADMIADPDQTLLLGLRGAKPIGCVLVVDKGIRDGQRLAYLGLLTVAPALQAAGLGRALLEAGERHARSFGATIMEMTVIGLRTELIAWYRRRGYALAGRQAPFPTHDSRFGLPKREDLVFEILEKPL
jgi:ribosomal protein S18 acetylase RimI-like enzyme